MEKESQKVIDVNIKKLFDMKMKTGNEMRYAHLDESNNVNSMFFLKGSRLYHIDLTSKKISECEFSKGNDIIYMTGNANNVFLLCVFKSGRIIAINSTASKIFKNINVTNFLGKKEINPDKFQVFASNDLDKLIIVSDCFIVMWYQNSIINKVQLNELTGTFFNISRDEEVKKLCIPKASSVPLNDPCYWNENISALFNNNYYLGSFCKVFYVFTIPFPSTKRTKLVIVEYLFRFDFNNKFRLMNEGEPDYNCALFDDLVVNDNEDLNDIRTHTAYAFLAISGDKTKERIVLKPNLHGNILAICLNYITRANTTMIFFMCETSRFSSCKLKTLMGDKQPALVQDMDWLCNDMFLLILFTNGAFMMINVNFQIILLKDSSNCILPDDLFYTPMHYNINKPKEGDHPKLIISKLRDDYFFIYSRAYAICFKANYSQYENRLINFTIPLDNFEDFLFELKFFQMYLASSEFNNSPDVDINLSVFDIIHQYLMSTLSAKSIRGANGEASQGKSETVNNINRSLVQYVRILRSVNQTHETNLTIITYLIRRSNDFFIHLLNHHEIWLATLFLEICEAYLLEPLKLQRNSVTAFTAKESNNNSGIKQELSFLLFHPSEAENISLSSSMAMNNTIKFSRLRLILLFFCLIEFRNNFALSINVLYFVLAKYLIAKIKQSKMLEEVLAVMKIIIKSYKYLKSENEQRGKEEFILNCLSMSYRNEAISQITISNTERIDISFNFFGDFYSFDEFTSFTELNENYCKNDEVSLINEYNALNNVGIIQKWIVLFTNYLYAELFQDIKQYLDNQQRQTFAKEKTSSENISPEEKTLSTLIYFNVDFFLSLLQFYFKGFLSSVIKTDSGEHKGAEAHQDASFLSKYYKLFLPFLSPVEVPFLIFEFYLEQSCPNKKTLPYEIKQCLFDHIEQRAKQFNITIDDCLDFIDFLILNGFKYDSDTEEDVDIELIQNSLTKLQKYIYSAFVFYLFLIHKTNMVSLYQSEVSLITAILDSFDSTLKRESYEYLFITLNGQLRYYLKKEATAKISDNEAKYIEIILPLVKHLFYKILIDESFQVRRNISEFVQMTPSVIKSYLVEGALYYEYKNLNRLTKSALFSFEDVLSLSSMKTASSVKDSNYFTAIFNSSILSSLFPSKIVQNVLTTLNNLLNLCRVDKELIFNIETNREYISKLILTAIDGDESNETMFNDMIYMTIDKVIKGNFDNKAHFKYSNNEFKAKLVRTIKVVLIKLLHWLNVLFLKIKMISSPSKDVLSYIKMISACLVYELNPFSAVEWTNKIIDYIAELNLKDLKFDIQKGNMLEILRNIKLISIKYKVGDSSAKKLEVIISKLEQENNAIYLKYISFVNEVFPQARKVFNKTKGVKSNHLRHFLISSFSDTYLDNIYRIYNQLQSFLNGENAHRSLLLKGARKKYIRLSEQFSELTGIGPKAFIEFKKNWQLVDIEQLYNLIVSDDMEDVCNIQKEEHTSLLMNRRQQSGVETPRRKSRLPYHKGSSSKDSHRNNRPRADSLDIREEVKPMMKLQGKAQNKIPKYHLKPGLSLIQPRQMIEETTINAFNKKLQLFILHSLQATIHSQSKMQPNGKKEELKFFSIKAKDNSIEVILLNKKFSEEHAFPKVEDKEKRIHHSIKPFDIINIKKLPTYDKAKHIEMKAAKIGPNTVKMAKFDELTEKLNKCEKMVMDMGKQFAEGAFLPSSSKHQ